MSNTMPFSKEIQFHPFKEGTRIANQSSYKALSGGLPGSKDSWLYGMLAAGIDDYTYLGTLLKANPGLLQHYEGSKWSKFLKGAESTAESRQLAEDLRVATETVYAVIDGYYVLKTLGKVSVRLLTETNKKIAIKYLKEVDQFKNYEDVSGFEFSLGSQKNIYHQSAAAAERGRWFSDTKFKSSLEATDMLALDYPGTTNFAQEAFTTKTFGLFVKGTAKGQGLTIGGGSQSLGVGFKLNNGYINLFGKSKLEPIKFGF